MPRALAAGRGEAALQAGFRPSGARKDGQQAKDNQRAPTEVHECSHGDRPLLSAPGATKPSQAYSRLSTVVPLDLAWKGCTSPAGPPRRPEWPSRPDRFGQTPYRPLRARVRTLSLERSVRLRPAARLSPAYRWIPRSGEGPKWCGPRPVAPRLRAGLIPRRSRGSVVSRPTAYSAVSPRRPWSGSPRTSQPYHKRRYRGESCHEEHGVVDEYPAHGP
jgi:hypothetical protein